MFNNILGQFPIWSMGILGNPILFNIAIVQQKLFSWRLGIVVCSRDGPPLGGLEFPHQFTLEISCLPV